MEKDLYKVLGLTKTATPGEIKKGYRTKAKEHHPDVGGDEEVFKDISYAYEVLTDENKKAIYDSRGHSGLNGNQGQRTSKEDFYNFMEQQQRAQEEIQMKHNNSIRAQVSISIEDIYNGVEKSFEYTRRVKCEPCDGFGGSNPVKCTTCNGSGSQTTVKQTQFGFMQQSTTCVDCKGVGLTYDDICTSCKGNGVASHREHHKETIEHGTLDGESIIVPGKGHIMPNGEFADLVMTMVLKPSNKFQVTQDYGLVSVVKIPYETLVLGGKVEFTTIDGSKVKFTVPEFSKVNNRLNLKEKGLRKKHFKHIRGNQMIILDVEMPTEIGDQERELLDKIKKLKE